MVTEGKWEIHETTPSSWHIYAGSKGNEVVLAAVRNQDFKDNARLIAAAPELLEACKHGFDEITSQLRNGILKDDNHRMYWYQVAEVFKAAIAEAEGTTQASS